MHSESSGEHPRASPRPPRLAGPTLGAESSPGILSEPRRWPFLPPEGACYLVPSGKPVMATEPTPKQFCKELSEFGLILSTRFWSEKESGPICELRKPAPSPWLLWGLTSDYSIPE